MHCLLKVAQVMGTFVLVAGVIYGWMHLCYKLSKGSNKGLAVCLAGLLFGLSVLIVVVNCAGH